MLMTAATVMQQLCKSCRTCFKFYCVFYFACDRSLNQLFDVRLEQLQCIAVPSTKSLARSWPVQIHGSVATRFRCGGMFSDYFIANLPLNVAVKKLFF